MHTDHVHHRNRIRVQLRRTIDESYDIEIGADLFEQVPRDLRANILPGASRIAIITDTAVRLRYGDQLLGRLRSEGIDAAIFDFTPGEKHKTRETKSRLEDALIAARFGKELASEGQTGRRLGQFNAVRNLAIILGGLFTLLGFKYLHFNFRIAFLIAAFFYLFSSVMLYAMHPGKAHLPAVHLRLYREYRLYYWLSILFGTRKQVHASGPLSLSSRRGSLR